MNHKNTKDIFKPYRTHPAFQFRKNKGQIVLLFGSITFWVVFFEHTIEHTCKHIFQFEILNAKAKRRKDVITCLIYHRYLTNIEERNENNSRVFLSNFVSLCLCVQKCFIRRRTRCLYPQLFFILKTS